MKIKSVIVYPHLGIKEEIEEEVNEGAQSGALNHTEEQNNENKDT